MSLLQELTEEWEQCERKMRDVHAWCSTSRTALESQQARRRPLRDQLAFCEKMSSDNGIQRTRLAMAVDKLGVRRRKGVGWGTFPTGIPGIREVIPKAVPGRSAHTHSKIAAPLGTHEDG